MTYLQPVAELSRLTGDVARQYYGRKIQIDRKTDGSPVTDADRAAERFARDWIRKRFPRDGIEGEEFGAEPGESSATWIIDPIDGTNSFVRGVPLWGTLVAVVEDEKVLAGSAFFPMTDEHIAAAPGEQCWWNDSVCRVSSTAAIAEATILCSSFHFGGSTERQSAWRRLEDHVAVSRTWGDCFGYLMVATGRAEVMVDFAVSRWDIAPFIPIIREAGGVFSDWSGQSSNPGTSAIATNDRLALPVREILSAGNSENAR